MPPLYIFKSYHVNSMLSEKLLHNFKYLKFTILLWFFSPLKSTVIFKMDYCHVLPTFYIPNIFTPSFYSFILLSFAVVLIFLLSFTPP